jgi:hypothetical protein
LRKYVWYGQKMQTVCGLERRRGMYVKQSLFSGLQTH